MLPKLKQEIKCIFSGSEMKCKFLGHVIKSFGKAVDSQVMKCKLPQPQQTSACLSLKCQLKTAAKLSGYLVISPPSPVVRKSDASLVGEPTALEMDELFPSQCFQQSIEKTIFSWQEGGRY